MSATIPEIASQQWAQVPQNYGANVSMKEIAIPSPKPDEVLVNLKYSGSCHSHLHLWSGSATEDPTTDFVDGHEGVGIVTAIGDKVKDIEIGDHVGVQWLNRSCGECESCKAGTYQGCPDAKFTGLSAAGTFSEYCTCQETHVIRIPKHYPLESVVHILCAGLIAYKAVKDSGAEFGQTVAISDAHTGLGILACQYAKASGLRVVALTEEESESGQLKSHHADHVIDYKASEDVVGLVKNITGNGPDAAIVLAADETPLQSAIEFIKPGGTVVLVGLQPGGSMQADFSRALSHMVNIKSSFGGSKQDTEEAMRIFVEKQFQTATRLMSLDQLSAVFQEMKRGELVGDTALKIPERREEKRRPDQTTIESPPRHSIALNNSQDEYNIGTYLSQRIQDLGVTDYFAVPGDTNLALLDEILKNPRLRMVSCCNELNTGYAADGYARTSTSKVAVVVIPYIVGGLSILNAIAGAHSARLKVVVISGCPGTSMLADDKFLHHTPSRTNRDQALHAFKGVTAASVRVDDPETATSVIDDTLLKCLDKSVPVYMEIANDLSTTSCQAPSPLQKSIDFARKDRETTHAIESIKKIWDSAISPVLLVGPLAGLASSKDEIQLLAESLGCAVLCQPDSRWIPDSHPQSCGVFWPGVNPEGEEIVRQSDLWVTLGGCWSDLHALGFDHKSESHRILDIQPEGVYFPDGRALEPVDLHSLVMGLIKSDIATNGSSIPSTHIKRSSPVPDNLQLSEKPLTMRSLLTGIQGVLRGHHTIIADTGETWFAANRLPLPRGAECQMQVAYASIGWSLGAGLGAQIGLPDRRVVILAGDGGFQMTAQELSTMIRMRINPIIFLFNNLGYKTETAVHEGPYNYIANWDYTKYAQSLYSEPHAKSYNPYTTEDAPRTKDLPMFAAKIQSQTDLALALQRAEAESGKLAFLECCIQPGDMTSELQRLGEKVGNEVAAQSDTSSATPSPTPSSDLSGESKSMTPASLLSPLLQPARPAKSGDLDASRIKVTLTKTPREVPPLDSPDVLSHKVCTDHMLQVRWSVDGVWDDPEIVPYGSMSFEPSASALHYSTMCFEGMKAFRGNDGKLRFFRANLNCSRLLDSATRVCLPDFNPQELNKLLKRLCEIDASKWLPCSQKGSSLYIRPTFIGTSAGLGLDVPKEALLYVIMSYWPNPTASVSSSATPKKGLRLWASPKDMARSWPGGFGSAKLAANYGPSLLAQKKAHAAGYDQVMWLFGPDRQVTEAGASNLFFIWRSLQGTLQGRLQLVTAPLENNLILPGVTRRSVLELARERMSADEGSADNSHCPLEPLEVVEKSFTIHDVIAAADQGRLRGAFVTGTACFITPVTTLHVEDRDIEIEADAIPHTSLFRKWMTDIVNGEEHSPWAEVVEG